MSEQKPSNPATPDCLKFTPASDVGHPPFFPGSLEGDADYAILGQLEGKWVNTDKTGLGLHTTCLPSPGTNSEQIPGKFHFISENYTETLIFKKVPGKVRNRGGANEQLIAALKYDQNIISKKTGKGIHEEVGMFMWLDDMYNHPANNDSIKEDLGKPDIQPGDGARGSTFVPRHTIARSGTIPHGNSILLLGSPKKEIEGKPYFPTGIDAWQEEHLSISRTMGGGAGPHDLDKGPPSFTFDDTLFMRNPSGNTTYTQRIFAHELYPYSVRPDLRLRDVIKDQNIISHQKIVLDTEFDNGQGPQGGVLSTPMVDKFTPVKKCTFRMWIEKVEEECGKTVLQLQYEQVMFFEFGFGTDGGTTFWPHIQVNTLRKAPEDESSK